MKKTLTIKIEADGEKEEITITDDDNEKKFKGAMVVGVSHFTDDFYMAGIGDPREVAYAFGEGLARGLAHDEMIGDNWYEAFYKCLFCEMAKRTGIRPENEITAEEALKKFEKNKDGDLVHKKNKIFN